MIKNTPFYTYVQERLKNKEFCKEYDKMKLQIIANKLKKIANELPNPPINTIIDVCKEKGLNTRQEIRELLGLDKKTFYKLLTGELEITEPVAKLLAEKIGSTPEFWVNRYNQYINNLLKM